MSQTKKLVVIGNSSIPFCVAEDINEFYKKKLWEPLGFINDTENLGSLLGKHNPLPVLARSTDLYEFLDEFEDTMIYYQFRTMKKQREMYQKFKEFNIPTERMAELIHPTAYMNPKYSTVGKGNFFAQHAKIGVDVVIGDFCLFFTNSFVGHDSIIGDFCTITNNVSINAEVEIGKGCHIGSNCTILSGVKIGDFVLVGSGTVVIEDIPDRAIVVGNPARIIGKTE